jgi:uncharacterized protein with HEPN domain
MRRDRQRLDDILEALDSLARIIQGRDEAEFLGDEIVRYATEQAPRLLQQIKLVVQAEFPERSAS